MPSFTALRAILVDLDGVLYEGDRPVPGARDAVAWLRAEKLPHLFLTNTTSRPRSGVVSKLAAMGIEVDAKQILTPPVAARDWIRAHTPGACALFVPTATAGEFGGVTQLPPGAEVGAGSVVIGDLGEGWDFPTLNRAFRLLMARPTPKLVALGGTRYWRDADGLRLDVGAYTAALERASGVRATIVGKPAPDYFELAVARLGVSAHEAAIVGDDIVGDVQGGQRAGLRGLLVRTGKFRPADLERDIVPDAVLTSLAELPRWWGTHV